MKIIELPNFGKWMATQTIKSYMQIYSRLAMIKNHGHFGDHRHLRNDLYELRWLNGRRVYYVVRYKNDEIYTVLIFGGNKNGQTKDIKQVEKILKKSGW